MEPLLHLSTGKYVSSVKAKHINVGSLGSSCNFCVFITALVLKFQNRSMKRILSEARRRLLPLRPAREHAGSHPLPTGPELYENLNPK
jgi:hypothetical protein